MDGTLELVQAKYPHVTSFSAGSNLGFGTANNLGVRRSCGEFLLFLNPDARVNSEALEHCLRRLQNETDIGIISPKLVLANGEMDLACRRAVPTVWDGVTRSTGLSRLFPHLKWFAGYNLTYLPDNETYQVGAVNGAFMMMRSSLFSRIGAFDESFFMYGEDLDLCLRCSKEGFKVVYDGRCSIIHIKGSSSRKVYRTMSKALFTGTKQFYLKHFNPRNSRVVRWKYDALFWLWSVFASAMGAIKGHKAARPL
jgi:GT2 family glycosyltransferase